MFSSLPRKVLFVYSCNLLSYENRGLKIAGLLEKWLYLVQLALSFAAAFYQKFFLPPPPDTAQWGLALSPKDSLVTLQRADRKSQGSMKRLQESRTPCGVFSHKLLSLHMILWVFSNSFKGSFMNNDRTKGNTERGTEKVHIRYGQKLWAIGKCVPQNVF